MMDSHIPKESSRRMAYCKEILLIFNVLTHDVVQRIQTEELRMWLYTDDMILLSERRELLQEAINKLQEWSQENDLIINRDKTKVMKFRKGGTPKNTNMFTFGGQALDIVKSYKYLGITLQVTGHTFSKHIEDRAVRAMKATVEIKKLNLLSIATALKLFTIK
jgi:Reverse transcriptase (RNA-dependent DNA polymerase).